MNRLSAVVLTALSAFFVIGCSDKGGLDLKEGDKLEVTQRLERERFEATYGAGGQVTTTNGAFREIPEGTVLSVFVTPKKGALVIEAVPIKAMITVTETNEDGTTTETTKVSEDKQELLEFFVPERYRRDDHAGNQFLYYSFHLNAEQLGTAFKKAE